LTKQGIDPANGPPLDVAVAALRERSQTTREMAEQARCYYEEVVELDPKSAEAYLKPVIRDALVAIRQALGAVAEWSDASSEAAVKATATALGLKLGTVAQPLRVALVGRAASPGIGKTLELVGRARSQSRIDRALRYIDQSGGA
jgi:glutamyl-tRNA synthetase